MTIKHYYLFVLILLSGCAGADHFPRQVSGHRLIKPDADKQAAEKKKNEILQLSNDLFATGAFTGRDQETIHYRMLTPTGQTDQKSYPLVMIFPSSGGIGTDNINQMRVLPKFWAQQAIRDHYPAYVVAIQFPMRSANYSKDADSLLISIPAPCMLSSLQLIDSLKKALPVDAGRIYAIGFSMGGSTANNAMIARPDLFAAGICISGIPMQEGAERIKDIPLWLIHGNNDPENPIPGDRAFYKRMHTLERSKTLFWEIEGLQHEIYSLLYTSDMIPQWLFGHHK